MRVRGPQSCVRGPLRLLWASVRFIRLLLAWCGHQAPVATV